MERGRPVGFGWSRFESSAKAVAGRGDGRKVVGAGDDDVGAAIETVIGVETTPPWPSSTWAT